MTCSLCNEELDASSKFCSSCGAAVGPAGSVRKTTTTASVVAVGDGVAVRRTVQSENSNPAATGRPLFSAGSESVVKATIDASTHRTVDKRQTVEGNYVAQQTIINESAVGSLVRLLTSGWSSGAAAEAARRIDKLPDDPEQMYEVLLLTNRHLIREAKNSFRGQQSLFANLFGGVSRQGSRGVMASFVEARKRLTGDPRIAICERMLQKLHDLAYRTNDQFQMQRATKMDEVLHTTRTLSQKMYGIEGKKLVALALAAIAPAFLILSAGTAMLGGKFSNSDIIPGSLLLLLTLVPAGGILYAMQRWLNSLASKLNEVELDLNTVGGTLGRMPARGTDRR